MDTKTGTLAAALLLGLGCSHATPKPQSPTTAMSTARRTSPPPYRQEANDATTSTARASDDAGETIYFDFDSANLRQDAGTTLQQVGGELRHSQKSVRIEGNCDERGTTEYNIALGDKRAWAAKHYLERVGIPDRRISIVSYGSERPKNPGHDETAWAQNRRDDFRIR
jgi:peptidoglycan-associated lipoprotein